jgi:hypothetical protein
VIFLVKKPVESTPTCFYRPPGVVGKLSPLFRTACARVISLRPRTRRLRMWLSAYGSGVSSTFFSLQSRLLIGCDRVGSSDTRQTQSSISSDRSSCTVSSKVVPYTEHRYTLIQRDLSLSLPQDRKIVHVVDIPRSVCECASTALWTLRSFLLRAILVLEPHPISN